jgi:thiamine pyridinylase
MHKSNRIVLAVICGALSCAKPEVTKPTQVEAAPPPVAAQPPAPPPAPAVTSLTVGLYPYVPRPEQFRTVIAAAWQQLQPGVTLQWAKWDGGYDNDPDSSLDVFVFDALNLSYFQSKGYLYPMSISQVTNYGDLVPFAAAGVTSGSQVLAIPQLGCGDFLFYYSNDNAIASATTATALAGALGSCSYYTQTPGNSKTGLMVDLSGGTTDASTYVESVHENTGLWPVPLPQNPAQMDKAASSTIQGVVGLSSFANVLYSGDNGYQRAAWFGQSQARAYVGFLESMSQISATTLSTMSFKPMPWSNNPTGTAAPLFYSDVVGVGAATASRGTTALAIQLANLMTSPAVIVQAFGPSGSDGPQYLMPVSTSAMQQLAAQYPVYQKMQTALQPLKPIFFNLGTSSKPWLETMKEPMKSMILANPKCYCDIASPPIPDNSAAQQICPGVCANHGGWNGQWTNQSGSVCGCDCPLAKAHAKPVRALKKAK